jgi:hypothetical protein
MATATATDLLTCAQAARFFPNRPSAKCVHRWRTEGVRSRIPPHNQILLKSVRIGGRLYTTEEFIREFIAATAAAPAGAPAMPVSPAERRKADRAAAMLLGRKGYKVR